MKRLIDWHLQAWKKDKFRKPLLIRGARQVGKTYAVRELGKSFTNFVEINLELQKEAITIFAKNLDPQRILVELRSLIKQKIIPGETLLFFDEIQACPQAIIALRYFYEIMSDLHVIAAGSLLDFAIEQVGIPVGRICSFYMHPLSFLEYLVAMGYSLAAEAILNQNRQEPMGETIHNLLLDLVGQYLAIGGLPEAVMKWIDTKDPTEAFKIHHQIATTYRQDFEKYAKKYQLKYLDSLFNQIPHFTGKQFKYSKIHGEYKKRELAPCLDLLCKANVIHKVHHSAGNASPLGAEINLEWFKVLFLDCGLCQSILGNDLAPWFLQPVITFANQGAIVESFVGQELLCYSASYTPSNLYFWKRDSRNSQAEVDFLYQEKGIIFPIEVKSGSGTTLKSLHRFLEEHPKSPYGIRFATFNYSFDKKIDSRPLYAVASLAQEDQHQSLQHLVSNP